MLKIAYDHEDIAVTQDEEAAPSYDTTKLPWNSRVRTSKDKLHQGLVAGSNALNDLSTLMQPMIAMYLNEVTPAGVVVTNPRFVQAYPFDAFKDHTLSSRSGRTRVIEGHIRSRSGSLEFNALTQIMEDGELVAFLPMRVRPFEEDVSADCPRYRVMANGNYRIDKTYKTLVEFMQNDPETGENTRQWLTIYLCPAQQTPSDREFKPLGDELKIGTIHAEAPEAAGEGSSRRSRRSRNAAPVIKSEEIDGDAGMAPVSLE